MATFTGRNGYGKYIKMEKEDPEEKKHREAQFLIYKSMKQAEQIVMRRSSSRPSNWLRLRISKLKVRIGKKFLRLRKAMLCNISNTKVGVYKHVLGHFRSLKGLFHCNRTVKSDCSTTAANVVPIGCHLSQPIFS